MKAIIYLRVSTEDQAESGLGVEAQRSACLDYCKSNGLEPIGIFVDDGVSGSLPINKRFGLMKAVAQIKKGYFLVVAKRDRLARNVNGISMIENELKKRKGLIVSADGQSTIDEDDHVGIMFRQMIDVFSQFENGMISSRTKEALHQKMLRGEMCGRCPPFGYRIIPGSPKKNMELDPEEQAIIARMRELRAKGYKLRVIREVLIREKKFNRKGNPFQIQAIQKMVKMPPHPAHALMT